MENIDRIVKKNKTAITIKNIVIYFFLAFWGLMILFPFYWMILTSIKTSGAYNSELIPKFITLNPTFENYIKAFTTEKIYLGRYLFNTLIYSTITTLLMVVVTILASFAFARLEFKGKNLVFTIFLSLMMIPSELVIITNYTTVVNLNLTNNVMGLALPTIASVFYIYLLRENFMMVPDNLYYAAKVDGTSDFGYLLKILIPLNIPTIISIMILKFIECWNSYAWPRLVTTDPKSYLVSNGIQDIRENGFGKDNIPAMMAAVVVVSIPLVALYLSFKKYIMTGVAKGGTKG